MLVTSAYREEIGDVGVARSNLPPVVLALVPILEHERRRVHEEEVGDLFIFVQQKRKMSECEQIKRPTFLLNFFSRLHELFPPALTMKDLLTEVHRLSTSRMAELCCASASPV